MYIEVATLVLLLGLYVFIMVQFRGSVSMLIERVNMLDSQIAEAIQRLPGGFGSSDGEPINPIQQAIAGLIQNVVENKQERAANGQFVKATIIEPAQDNN